MGVYNMIIYDIDFEKQKTYIYFMNIADKEFIKKIYSGHNAILLYIEEGECIIQYLNKDLKDILYKNHKFKFIVGQLATMLYSYNYIINIDLWK